MHNKNIIFQYFYYSLVSFFISSDVLLQNYQVRLRSSRFFENLCFTVNDSAHRNSCTNPSKLRKSAIPSVFFHCQ